MSDSGAAFERLVALVARLRAPDGCPWDQAQTLESMRGGLLEEVYEVLEALEAGDVVGHQEELGDLLFQIVFQAQLRAEAGAFDAAAVCEGITQKMLRRHPHVFGDQQGLDREAIRAAWERQKRAEKGRASALDGVPLALPALTRAARLGSRAARVGFDWPSVDGVFAKLDEEVAELQAARASGDRAAVAAELGDCLFTLVNLARHLEVDPEAALRETSRRFEGRFRLMEKELAAKGRAVEGSSAEALDAAWEAAKAALAAQAQDPERAS